MATATANETKSDATTANTVGLLPASVIGAVVLLAGIGLIGYAVPLFWDTYISPTLRPHGGFVDSFLRVLLLMAAVAGVVYAIIKLSPANPPRGLRGGVFLVAFTFIVWFTLVRWFGLAFEGMGIGAIITGVIAAALGYGAFKFLTSQSGRDTMIAIEEMGWFHSHSFKKTQGLLLRRSTMAGIILVGFTGIYSLNVHNSLPAEWSVKLPFTAYEKGGVTLHKTLPLLSDFQYTGPILIAVLTVWVAWRSVNIPVFADFLIATEAEMNKVSWTTWKKLLQDTIVVLVTTALLTAFLLVIDIFWGWLLSGIDVLPQRAPIKATAPGESTSW
ncbi:MAG: preprotein translocase subunit SecE [Gemmataceae bacterium]